MDPIDSARTVKRPNDDPPESANELEAPMAQESGKQPGDIESLVHADARPIDDLRREKIESLKKAVDDGTYSVSAEEVARKVMEHMLEPKD
jgi:anti-sigma28 factor (negative regulator of flagellin synthesis)